MRDASAAEALLDSLELALTVGREHDCERHRGQVSRRAFPGRMHELCGLDASWKICPDDAVVRPTGFEPAVPKLLTLGLRPIGQTRMKF